MHAAEKYEKQATDAADQLAETVRRIMEVKKGAKLAAEKLADMKRQMTRSVETTVDALRSLNELSRRAELLEEKDQSLKLRLSKMLMAGNSAATESKK